MARQRRGLRIALFVEGPPYSDFTGRIHLENLWTRLGGLCGIPSSTTIHVIGFSKGQLRKMEAVPEIRDAGTQALDLLVAQHYEKENFDRVIVAFDALPENQDVVPKGCMRKEIDFVLRHFEGSSHLPTHVRNAASDLRQYYSLDVGARTGRQPGALEILYMWPNFEGLLVTDEATVKRALVGHGNPTPPKWPTFDTRAQNPDQSIMPKAVECASKAARDIVRGSFKTNKHGWAEFILRYVRENSKMLQHQTATRLAVIASDQ
jgi:hypothetical protein